jgi:L-ascorbate metabolism protein UlaG (beta-lactamase superfamily)
MNLLAFPLVLSVISASAVMQEKSDFPKDVLKTSDGNLVITFFAHASLLMEYHGKLIYIDPVMQYADYTRLPKADLIVVTHQHGDHFDPKAIEALLKEGTVVVVTPACNSTITGSVVLKNGDEKTLQGIPVEAVPAYNLVHKRDNGAPFHPKGEGNGYVLTFGRTKVYVAGDTENTPEMKALKGIDVAFLPMNLPYTMTPEMVADAARAFRPKILYPYHFGQTDPSRLVALLKDEKGIEVRLREMR